jgi:hypothetical protein
MAKEGYIGGTGMGEAIDPGEFFDESSGCEDGQIIDESEGDGITWAGVEAGERTFIAEDNFCEEDAVEGIVDDNSLDTGAEGSDTIGEEGKGIRAHGEAFLEEVEEEATGFDGDVDKEIFTV